MAAMRGGPQFRPWTTQVQLQAAMVNLLGAANYQRAGKRGKVLVKPPVKRRVTKRTVTVSSVGRRALAALQRVA